MINPKTLGDIEFCLLEIKNGRHDNNILNQLRDKVNKLSKAKCDGVGYTNNTDKLFFGMCVYPIYNAGDVYDILCTEKNVEVSRYYIELDSKLFDPRIDLNGRELTAVLLHEIGHINGPEPTAELRVAVDEYLAKNDDVISSKKVIDHSNIFKFAITDAISQMCNIFNSNVQEEIDADTFVVKLGYAGYLESALDKVYKNGFMLNSDVNNKFAVLSWCFRVTKDFSLSRIPTIRKLEKARTYAPSNRDKNMIDDLIKSIKNGVHSTIKEHTTEAITEASKSFLNKFKYKGIRGFEDDLAEFTMRMRNVDREDEAILLMRSINTRMGIIDDYIYSEALSPEEIARWNSLYMQYSNLRSELANKHVYKLKDLSLYINYPDIKTY